MASRQTDAIYRELVIVAARFGKISSDIDHLARAWRAFTENGTLTRTGGADGEANQASQPSLVFGSGSEEDHD